MFCTSREKHQELSERQKLKAELEARRQKSEKHQLAERQTPKVDVEARRKKLEAEYL